MDIAQTKGSRIMDALFQTGYPHPINLFVTLMLLLLPALTALAGNAAGDLRSPLNYGLSGTVSLVYLLVWSRMRVYNPLRSSRFFQVYLIVQTILVSLTYVLDGGLTRFLFVVVAVQAVYVTPVRRWAPFLGTVSVLWLTLYLAISPNDPGANKVAVIGMYLCYLIFAAVVTFTTVQQERQVEVARELLGAVEERHHTLRAYDLTVEPLAEMEERERLAQTIYAGLLQRFSRVMDQLENLRQGVLVMDRQSVRSARLQVKDLLGEVRNAVRTLRPGEGSEIEETEDRILGASPEPDVSANVPDPIRVYNVWNIGIIVITTGVMVASDLVGGTSRWLPLLLLGLALLAAYAGTALSKQPRGRTLYLVLQAGLSIWMTWLSQEPLMNHLLLSTAAQIVFLVPLLNRWVVAAVVFPTLLSGAALWSTDRFVNDWLLLLSLTVAFSVTYFFSAVMAFMTRRQVEARQQAMTYATQMAQVNRLLEAKLQEIRRMVIARERIRMAREIHDSWGHHLTMAIVELQYAEELAKEDKVAAVQYIISAQTVVRAAIESSREMVVALERFDYPLLHALKELVSTWKGDQKVKVSILVNGDFSGLSPAVRVTLYRVVQESLTNIQKHARARQVEIVLSRQSDRVLLMVTNDETGEATEGDTGQGGFGLLGLRERADALQGEFSAGVRPEGGFYVKLVLPLGA